MATQLTPPTFELIEQGIVDTLVARGLRDAGNIPPSIDVGIPLQPPAMPWVRSLITQIKYVQKTNKVYLANLVVSVFLQVRDLRSDKDRRNKVWPLLRGIIDYLSSNNIGLDILPLIPIAAADTTDYETEDTTGLIQYQIDFKTAMQVVIPPAEEAGDVLSIVTKYFLDPDSTSITPDAEDLVEFAEPEGD